MMLASFLRASRIVECCSIWTLAAPGDRVLASGEVVLYAALDVALPGGAGVDVLALAVADLVHDVPVVGKAFDPVGSHPNRLPIQDAHLFLSMGLDQPIIRGFLFDKTSIEPLFPPP